MPDFTSIFQGFKTFAAGLAVAIVPSALQYIAGIDPVAVFGLSPVAGMVIGGAFTILRALTKTSIFQKA